MAETGVTMELSNEEFQIETHGIDIIPESQRGGSPRRGNRMPRVDHTIIKTSHAAQTMGAYTE